MSNDAKKQELQELLKVGEELVTQKKLKNGDLSERVYPFEGRNESLAPSDMSRFIRQARESVELPEIDISNPEQVQNRINWYLDRCEMNGTKPTIVGLCNVIGIDRKTLYRWGAGIDRASTHQKMIVRYKNLLEELWEMEMLEGKINPIVGIFIGKNHFGYTDKQDIVVTPNNPLGELKPTSELEEYYLESVADENV
ncbi:MAG: terminase small subunit [Oscillospiraceae bacterium]|nr:terminase small subunit [Oscillospiraceae bacterium]